MNKLRKNLLDSMIRIYGFEHEAVVQFARACESMPDDEAHDKRLRFTVMLHQECPVMDEEEEEDE